MRNKIKKIMLMFKLMQQNLFESNDASLWYPRIWDAKYWSKNIRMKKKQNMKKDAKF